MAILVGVATTAYANVPHSFKDGDVLTALDLNENFNALDQRISALENKEPPLNVDPSSATNEVAELCSAKTMLSSSTKFR